MTAFVTWRVTWRGHRPLLVAGMGYLVAAFAVVTHPTVALAADPVAASTLREPVTVNLDQAKLLKLPERTATLVIGNPLIADAAVQPGGVVVLTAKSYGMTNMVALDRSGVTLVEYPIQVVGPSDAVVVVFRGTERESYSCAPDCERRITLGDSMGFFGANLNAVGAFSAIAEKK
jgi:Flp pilus assembly secretin CpaC